MQMDALAETSELLAFVRTVEAGSVSAAAAELGVPRPTVSRRLARLEERLGARLLRRTTRRLAVTDAGEELYRHARAVVAAVRDAEAAVRRADGEVRGLLRVSAPPANDGLRALYLSFLDRYPAVRLEIDATTHHVDLVTSGFDVAIRATTDLAPGLVARQLFRARSLAVAAPAYLAAAGTPTRAEELAGHACLTGYTRGERPQTEWPLRGGGRVRVEPRLAANDFGLLLLAARAGKGIAVLPEPVVVDDLAHGALVHVLPGVVEAPVRFALVYAEREFLPPAVRAFVDHVAERAPSVFADAMRGARPR